jgi:hypothetical protein
MVHNYTGLRSQLLDTSYFLLPSTLLHLLESFLFLPVLNCLDLVVLLVLVLQLIQPGLPNLQLVMELTDSMFPTLNQERRVPLPLFYEFPFLAIFLEVSISIGSKYLLVMEFH